MAAADQKSPKVCVIGAGLAGLLALKECLSEGLSVQCFEVRTETGGQWAQQPDATADDAVDASAVQSSMYDGVVLNSCRDTSAAPDFPLDPARYGDYFSHRLQLRYMREYAAHFGLDEHIRLGWRVVSCEPRGDGGWVVRVRRVAGEDGKDEIEEEHSFDAVLVCVGHLSTPSTPVFPGRDVFRGQFLHSHYYRRPGPFDRKKVVLVGFGSSAVDIACELAPGAAEVHVVTRRGGWVLPRYVLGKPTEAWDNRATQVWVPVKTAQWLQTKLLNIVDGEPPEIMQPEHKLLEQSPTIRGDFTEKVRTGIIKVHRGDVERLTEHAVVVSRKAHGKADKKKRDDKSEDDAADEEVIEADVVITCTGYNQFEYPFLPQHTIRGPSTPADRADLYKLIAPPDHPGLFVLGHAEIFGPAAPVFDAQARWACAAITGRVSLPSREDMRASIAEMHRFQDRHFVAGSERHALCVYAVPYVDDLLEPLGARPSFGRCLGRVFTGGHPWRALKVLNAVWFGIPSAAQWRLFGHGAKEALATETLLRVADGAERLSEGEVRLLEVDVRA